MVVPREARRSERIAALPERLSHVLLIVRKEILVAQERRDAHGIPDHVLDQSGPHAARALRWVAGLRFSQPYRVLLALK